MDSAVSPGNSVRQGCSASRDQLSLSDRDADPLPRTSVCRSNFSVVIVQLTNVIVMGLWSARRRLGIYRFHF